MFQFSFYSDETKTTQLTGLSITLDSLLVRQNFHDGMTMDAYVGSGSLTDDGGADNSKRYSLTDVLNAANDGTNSFGSDLALAVDAAELDGAESPEFYSIAASGGMSMTENDFMWFRRDGVNEAYQLAGVTVVVPEPSTYALIGGLLAMAFVVLRRRK